MEENFNEKIGFINFNSEGILRPYPYLMLKTIFKALSRYLFEEVKILYESGSFGGFGRHEIHRGKGEYTFYINPYPEDVSQLPFIILSELGHIYEMEVEDRASKLQVPICKDISAHIYADLVALYFLKPSLFVENSDLVLVKNCYRVIQAVFNYHDFGEERREIFEMIEDYKRMKEKDYEDLCMKNVDSILINAGQPVWLKSGYEFRPCIYQSFEELLRQASEVSD
jgi:hypothetical protein